MWRKVTKILNVLVPLYCSHCPVQWLGRSSPGGADRSPLIASFLSDWPNKWRPASSYKLLFLQNAWKGQQCNAKSVSSSYSSGGKKRRHFLRIGRRMKCHWFPSLGRILPQEVLASGRMNTNVTPVTLYHCPVTAFSTSALRNSWTYQQSVSPGLTPTVTRKWCPLVCNELMKHPWKCTVCTVHCTRHTIACD